MSNITSMPLWRIFAGVQTDEDLLLGLQIKNLDGSPLDLFGISFTVYLFKFGKVIASFPAPVVGGSNNIIIFYVLQSALSILGSDTYSLSLVATDSALKRRVLGNSTLTIGSPQTISGYPIDSSIIVSTIAFMIPTEAQIISLTLSSVTLDLSTGQYEGY